MFGCNKSTHLEGSLKEEPTSEAFVGTYVLDGSDPQSLVSQMGYKGLRSTIIVGEDGSFSARNVPADAMLAIDRRGLGESASTYNFEGKWNISQQLSSYCLNITIDKASHESGPLDSAVMLESDMPGVIPFEHAVIFRNSEPLTLAFPLMQSAQLEVPAFLVYQPEK